MSQSGDNKTMGPIVTLPLSSSRFWRASQSDAAQAGTDSGGILNDKTPCPGPCPHPEEPQSGVSKDAGLALVAHPSRRRALRGSSG